MSLYEVFLTGRQGSVLIEAEDMHGPDAVLNVNVDVDLSDDFSPADKFEFVKNVEPDYENHTLDYDIVAQFQADAVDGWFCVVDSEDED